jgi:hypothetical protein
MAKQLEELKKTTAKQLMMLKLMEKLSSKEAMEKAILELAKDLDIPLTEVKFSGEPINLEDAISQIAEAYLKKDLERILKENGNNNHS